MDNLSQFALETAPEQLAKECIETFHSSGQYPRHIIERLIHLSLSEEIEVAKQASRAFFAGVVEPLSDSFDGISVSFYNRAFSRLIEQARKTQRGAPINSELKTFRLASEDDLVARADALRRVKTIRRLGQSKQYVQRVSVLSRVTLGADVAITSIIIERMKLEFPNAEIVIIGGRKAAELFGGDQRVSFKEINYSRSATAIEKLLSWIEVLHSVREAIADLHRGDWLIVDPDSRLTQLGLLPITQSENESDDYLFFPSREYGSNSRLSLGELTSKWLDEVFGQAVRVYPNVYLNPGDVERGSNLVKRMRSSERPVITINFGVGENPKKRISSCFESALVCHLLETGAMVILDKGAGDEESKRADSIIKSAQSATAQGRAIKVVEADESKLDSIIKSHDLPADLLVWSGRIGLLAAMIGESDLYIGYDSAGQHIAAAMRVPCIDIFAGYSSPRMLDRWRPARKAELRVVAVDPSSAPDEDAVIADVLREVKELLKR